MKTTKQNFIVMVLAFFAICALSYGQNTHYITLHVDEDGAFSFSAGEGTVVVDESSPEAFTILVYEDDEIEWDGEAESGEVVDIEKIKFPNDHKIFEVKDLEGKVNNGKKKAKGKVAKGKKNKTYKYTIDFTVGGEPFSIDPGLKVGQ